jgi:hypothetical protein
MSKTNNKAAAEGSAATAEKPPKVTKMDAVLALLRRPEGANVAALSTATGWQAHSVRGAIAGHIKKKLGLTVITTKVDGATVYRIEA